MVVRWGVCGMHQWFEVEELESGLWALAEPHADSVTSYLLEGKEWALLVDTGLGIGNIRETAESLTGLPLVVVNTHAHYDHIGGNRWFDGVWAHDAERERIETGVPHEELGTLTDPAAFLAEPPSVFNSASFCIPGAPVTRALVDGDLIDLGDRVFEVIHAPGHSPGSICLWESQRGILVAGDVVYFGNIFACLPEADFGAYRVSLKRLAGLATRARLVLPGHGPTPLSGKDICAVEEFFSLIADGLVQGRRGRTPWGPALVYASERFSVLLKP